MALTQIKNARAFRINPREKTLTLHTIRVKSSVFLAVNP
ncbi:hypothetical protein X946_4923 [Burkholderia sp. ABCPW 111]|nr:hypothetical protein X946_4923 [Burkholderia sp. ABCPW 111]